MKTSDLQKQINNRVTSIAALQDELKALQMAAAILHGNGGAGTPLPAAGSHGTASPTSAKRKYTRRATPKDHQRIAVGKSGLSQRPGGPSERKAPTPVPATPAGGVALPSDKPDTVPGAIKALLRDEPPGATFEVQLLRANLLEHPDYKPLLEAEGGEKSFSNCINNWTNAGHFKKAGHGADAELTITASGKAWFNK